MCVLPVLVRSEWLERGAVKKLVLVVSGVDTEEVLERWVFDVHTDEQAINTGSERRHKRTAK